MRKMFRKAEAGFTLIEMLIVVLIVGVLAAVAAPVYLGYVSDSKLAEAKALAGSALSAAETCRQFNATAFCDTANLNSKLGLDATGLGSGGKWKVTIDNGLTLNANTGNWGGIAQPVLVEGQNGTFGVNGMKAGINLNAGVFSTMCDSGSGTFQPC